MIDCRAHYNDRRQSGDQGPSLFPAGADQPTGHPPAPSTGIAELESRLCRAGGFGRSEHQALAVVGVVLVGIAITEHPLPLLLKILRPIKAASTVGAEWDHSASPSHPQRENIETGCRMLYRVLAHGLEQPGGSAAPGSVGSALTRRKWRRFSPPLTHFLLRSPPRYWDHPEVGVVLRPSDSVHAWNPGNKFPARSKRTKHFIGNFDTLAPFTATSCLRICP